MSTAENFLPTVFHENIFINISIDNFRGIRYNIIVSDSFRYAL